VSTKPPDFLGRSRRHATCRELLLVTGIEIRFIEFEKTEWERGRRGGQKESVMGQSI
jgi:hypothetical protein